MANVQRGAPSRAPFTRSMRKDYTILMPSMMPIHFELVRTGLSHSRPWLSDRVGRAGRSPAEQCADGLPWGGQQP